VIPVDIAHIMVESGDHKVIQAVFRDVTGRKRAGEALRDSEQKLRLLASQLLTVQEKERRRVSRELHDELGQALTVLKIHLVAIENKLRRDQQGLKVSCERLLGYIDGVIENVRRLSWDLSPSILEDLGLSSSLKYLVQEICRNNHMLYSVAVDEIDNLFSPEVKINIYRIFQESLTNIVRHAQASRIKVKIKKQKDRVTFLLRDNGIGFDVKAARSRNLDKRGLGLTTMHERALMAGGTLSISSHKGQGTDVILTTPL
jgi:signal transduction histidine kinase